MSNPKRDITNGISFDTLISDTDGLLTAAWEQLNSRDGDRELGLDLIALAREHRALADTLNARERDVAVVAEADARIEKITHEIKEMQRRK